MDTVSVLLIGSILFCLIRIGQQHQNTLHYPRLNSPPYAVIQLSIVAVKVFLPFVEDVYVCLLSAVSSNTRKLVQRLP